MNFPLRTAFVVSHRFFTVVCSLSFHIRNFFISSMISFLTHSLFNSILFSLCVFEWFWGWFLVSGHCGLRRFPYMISIFLNLLRLALCPIMWSLFANVPCAFEKNVYFLLFWDESFYVYIRPLDLIHHSLPQYLCWYFVWKIYPLLTVGC